MKRAQSMAQAALSRPGMRLSSWSCMGPRRRSANKQGSTNDGAESLESSAIHGETSEPFLATSEVTSSSIDSSEIPVSSSGGVVWSSGSCSSEIRCGVDADLDEGEDVLDHDRHQDRMTEVELWQQIEKELYDQIECEESDVVKEIREEEAAAIAEVSDSDSESSLPNTKEVHRFFPPGRIMHIVTLLTDEVDCGIDSITSSSLDHCQPAEPKVGIFLTPRSLYSKLRLSQTMIADHFMPVYRRQMEKLIRELDEESSDSHRFDQEI